MLLLAIDTSTPAITVALHDGAQVVSEATTVDSRRHTEFLVPQVMTALGGANALMQDVTSIAVGTGPGPFTGLRVGLAAARMLGAAMDVPVVGVCSLDVLAYEVAQSDEAPEDFAVATDARRREVYWALYGADGTRRTEPDIGPAASLPKKLPAAGAGPRIYPDDFAGALVPEYPSAMMLAEAVATGAVDTSAPDPLYLRHADAKPPGARKSVLT